MITKLAMTNDKTVDEYLAQARTLIKIKLKSPSQWNLEFNKTNAFHVCNEIVKQGLKFKDAKVSIHIQITQSIL